MREINNIDDFADEFMVFTYSTYNEFDDIYIPSRLAENISLYNYYNNDNDYRFENLKICSLYDDKVLLLRYIDENYQNSGRYTMVANVYLYDFKNYIIYDLNDYYWSDENDRLDLTPIAESGMCDSNAYIGRNYMDDLIHSNQTTNIIFTYFYLLIPILLIIFLIKVFRKGIH